MSIVFSDGFESADLSNWTVTETTGSIPQVFDDGTIDTRTDTYACLMVTSATTFGGLTRIATEIRAQVSVEIADELTVTARVRETLGQTSSNANVRIRLYVDDGDGTKVLRNTINGNTFDGTWQTLTWSGSATGTTCRLWIRADNEAPGNMPSQYFSIDDVEVDAVGTTTSVRANVVVDLLTITTGNGYENTLAKVYTEPVDMTTAQFPFAALVPSQGGTTDPLTFSHRSGECEQRVTILIAVQSQDPYSAIESLLDDARNALERKAGAVNSMHPENGDAVAVQGATIVDWDEPTLTGDMHNWRAVIRATVEVRYTYPRGSL